ncbi:Lar family restriction alleviation protein [Agrobacterium vitis]|uniref:Lar family restriction alleviation protein n=1 Tax=Agrobacterium vitis TaxID=373 RepID=UPI0009BE4B2C|nr:Lar family restriction alleviation protein [Agrobacterium vitis]MUO84803.1 hypothetical protein [Agrobacterium vitis]
MTDTLLPCPFCGSTELTIAANQFSWVACAFCAAEGPQVVSISEATKTWNRRAMTAIECGGEAPPVYVVEMEEAPSTALKVLGVVQVCPICDIAGCHHLRYRKKPVVIEAIQWNGENVLEIYKFMFGAPTLNSMMAHDKWYDYENIRRGKPWHIKTLEDGPNSEAKHVASVGDWIIKGIQGEFYPCKPDIFSETYSPAVEPHPDDIAVDQFAAAMKHKLAQKRAEGRGGWENKEECSNKHLSRLLRQHVEKGDPLDVMNFAMMIHQRGERIDSNPLFSGWLPIEEADNDIAYTHDLGEIKIGCSYPIWVRDADGRIFSAIWSDNGKKAYWWDIEGESPVDPVEFLPHPFDRETDL